MTRRLQKPSLSWKTGVDQRRTLSQVPTVAVSNSPFGPKIHSLTDASLARFPLKVRSTQLLLSAGSTEK